MRILAVHNRYQISGGEDICHQTEVELLRRYGHIVDEYVEDNARVHRLGRLRTAFRTIWSIEDYKNIKTILKNTDYDGLIVQNFFPLISPSVFYAANQCHVPVIQVIHNYRLACLNATFLRDGRVCEACLGKKVPWKGIFHGCYRKSRAGSLAVALMLVIHRILGTWNQKVNQYLALSDFGREKLIANGIPPEKIAVRPNTLSLEIQPGDGSGNFALFVGRLSPEKGIETLMAAWEGMEDSYRLILIGDGELREDVEERSRKSGNIEICGFQPNSVTIEWMRRAKFLVLPSIWYEGMPRAVIEAFAAGTPVIASEIGAMKDMIQNGINGFLFEPGNAKRLTELAKALFQNEDLRRKMRIGARNSFNEKYSPECVYQKTENILEKLINKAGLG